MNRTLADIQCLPVFADVIVEIDHDLKISLGIRDSKELHFAGVTHPVRRQHVFRIDIEEQVEDGMGGWYDLKFPIGKEFPHLLLHVFELRVVGLVSSKIIHQQETAAIEVLSKILHVTWEKIQVAGLGNVYERIFEQLFAVDIYDLI